MDGAADERPTAGRGADLSADLAGRWALVVAASALAVTLWASLAPALGGGPGAGELRASRFLVVDEEGTTRAALGVTDRGPTLELLDERGGFTARIQSGSGGPELRFDGPEGQLRLGLGEVVRSGAGLSLYDADDRLRLGLAYSRGTATNLVLTDGRGRVRVTLAVDSAGPYVALLGPGGEPIWEAPSP